MSMDALGPPAAVQFRNVGQFYFPQTRVECHLSLGPDHRWSSRDWIGIFKVGWTSTKEYYTYTWVNVPENYSAGSTVDCCALFHAFYLPRPGPAEYEFVYVDQSGKVCGRSRTFNFCSPKPLEELETVREERDEERGDERDEDELMVVVPRATLLQNRLDESLKSVDSLQRALDESRREAEEERERSKQSEQEWESERAALKKEKSDLQQTITQYTDMLKRMEGRHQDVKYNQENLSSELSKLLTEKVESLQRIKELEEDEKELREREREANAELERLRDRVKKMSSQMKHEEEKRKALQCERDAQALELRALQERLDSSELQAQTLRRDLREMTSRHSLLHTELQQSRLQGAQLSLQLSQDQLQLREERAAWALEREGYRQAAETDQNKLEDLYSELRRKEEWLQDERAERERLEKERDQIRAQQRELLESVKRNTQRGREEQMSEDNPRTKSHDGDTSSDDEDRASSSSSLSPVSSEVNCPQLSDSQVEEELYESAKENLNVPKLIDPTMSEACDPYVW
ncbi:calcium-binding and coiled-coil domain-containing protein 1-like [Periophthalmus magnuspinnatus]|uniref:calcium-binding and coiled-coil domain-containing protein 1-like n=1 Tax=Periophthalmus magnuspinnatus TaxID=409849 RepID=UPI00243640E1|nr:calcium-binding and coiled-coil domain-containing protein 1-like [Periophthalmus magnuspinnatus]